MSWLTAIPIVGKLFEDTADIIKEAVTDKDKQNQILGNLEAIKLQVDKEVYIKELETKTIPWLDALHKMGRQLLNFVTIIAVCGLLLCGIEITPTVALILTGGNIAYQVVKGPGNNTK
uniref:Uncharacterized protein n=1 Tax=viral metagenome TaxID=1070528 RepID=A0A6M3LJI9_9ZZZZ